MATITALNGRLPADRLVVVDTGPNGPQQLRTDAAAVWRAMLAAGMPAGCLRSGYRTRAQQAAEVARAKAGLTPSAAAVGTSQHGEGLAADVDEPARSWCHAHADEYGLRFPIASELWHTELDQAHAPARTRPTPAPVPAPVPEEDIMASLDDLRSVLREQETVTLWRLAGTAAAWLDLGTARRWVTGAQAAGMSTRIVDLPASDPVWALPIVGPCGELVRRSGEAAAWLVADGHRRWLDAAAYAAAGSPLITDLPATHPVWALPTVGALPA